MVQEWCLHQAMGSVSDLATHICSKIVTVGVIINGALSRGKMSIISVPLVIKSTVCRCTRPCAAVLPAKCGIPTTGPTFPPTTAPIGPGHNSLKIAKINKRNHRKLSLTHDLTWPLSCQTKKSTKHNPHEVTHHKISTHPSQYLICHVILSNDDNNNNVTVGPPGGCNGVPCINDMHCCDGHACNKTMGVCQGKYLNI